jgi:hypothetical protein
MGITNSYSQAQSIMRLLMKALLGLLLLTTAALAADPLPSWNDGPAKQAIVSFVEQVTKEGSPAFVPPAERTAAFDNDGTLCRI